MDEPKLPEDSAAGTAALTLIKTLCYLIAILCVRYLFPLIPKVLKKFKNNCPGNHPRTKG